MKGAGHPKPNWARLAYCSGELVLCARPAPWLLFRTRLCKPAFARSTSFRSLDGCRCFDGCLP
eukprot:scaffold2616_cov105-Pinguiococcus_pyrenoidosus.AAC.1